MKAVWTQQPPTPEERANVVAFLAQAGLAVRPTQAIWQLVGLTGLGAVILLLIAGFRLAEPAEIRGTASDDGYAHHRTQYGSVPRRLVYGYVFRRLDGQV